MAPFVGRSPLVTGEWSKTHGRHRKNSCEKIHRWASSVPCTLNGNSVVPLGTSHCLTRLNCGAQSGLGTCPRTVFHVRVLSIRTAQMILKEGLWKTLWISVYVMDYTTRYSVCQGPKTQFFKNFSKYCVFLYSNHYM